MTDIHLDNVVAGYLKQQSVLNSLTITLSPRQVVGLVAPNGSGKTTLMRVIKGDIDIINGKMSGNLKFSDIFFLDNQEALLPSFSIKELLSYVYRSFKSTQSVDDVIQRLKIEKYQHKKIKNLSLGMRQMAMMAVYIIADSPVMLFDEPINGLDQVNMEIVANEIRRLSDSGKSIIVSSHLLDNLVDFVDVFWYLKDGQIVQQVPNNGQVAQVKQLYLDLYRGGEYE